MRRKTLWYNGGAVNPNVRAPAREPRLAKNYQMIYDLLRERGPGSHLSVADVHELAKRRNPGIGATTVYRALTRLRECGLVSEIELPGAANAYYEAAGEAHAHFRCERCGQVEDVAFALSPAAVAELAEARGAEVTGVSLTLQGRCATCRDRGA